LYIFPTHTPEIFWEKEEIGSSKMMRSINFIGSDRIVIFSLRICRLLSFFITKVKKGFIDISKIKCY